MDDWFNLIASSSELPKEAAQELREAGFVVVAGPVAPAALAPLAAAYDAAVSSADPADIGAGRTTTRVHDFVNRGPEFDELYIHKPILGACCSVIGRPFKLSTMLARTLNPNSPAQELHVDFRREADGWPMVGFIIMIDDFRRENGATRFVPRSHLWPEVPSELPADYGGRVSACGPAGSVIIYNGSVWHGHGPNVTSQPRRSIQGAYIRREARAGVNMATRMRPDTLSPIGGLAKYLLDL
jgi:ectoine hydroxylase-related dioxygenase (phytanoyl-CoA dioxygenase family)